MIGELNMNSKLICALLMATTTSMGMANTTLNKSVISLNTSLTEEVTQDVVVVTVVSEATSANPKEAFNQVNKALNAARALATSRKVAPQQSHLSTFPQYSKNKVTGWTVRASFKIESSDLKEIQDLMSELKEVVKIEGVSYKVSDKLKDKVEQDLSSKAMSALDKRATSIVGSDKSLNLDEFNVSYSGGVVGVAPMRAMAKSNLMEVSSVSADSSFSIEPGTESVTINVSAKYAVNSK